VSYEISIDHGPETGSCRCTTGQCGWHEEAASHTEVQDMRFHAVQHSIAEGHRVDMDARTHDLVRPRSGISY
jgi:hypothetical protein